MPVTVGKKKKMALKKTVISSSVDFKFYKKIEKAALKNKETMSGFMRRILIENVK